MLIRITTGKAALFLMTLRRWVEMGEGIWGMGGRGLEESTVW